MTKKMIFTITIAMIVASLTLGCVKTDVDMTVHENGSMTASFTMGMQEMYWNMSGGMNSTFGNFSFFGNETELTENATEVWKENGWVYVRTEGIRVPEENMSLEIDQYPSYTEYVIRANMTDVDDTPDEGGDIGYNLSDPMVRGMLESMTFDFSINMPGEIVDHNAHDVANGRATWNYNGITMENATTLYAKSHYYGMPEGLTLLFAIVTGGLMVVRKSRSG